MAVDVGQAALGGIGYGFYKVGTNLSASAAAWADRASSAGFFRASYYVFRSGLAEGGADLAGAASYGVGVPSFLWGGWTSLDLLTGSAC